MTKWQIWPYNTVVKRFWKRCYEIYTLPVHYKSMKWEFGTYFLTVCCSTQCRTYMWREDIFLASVLRFPRRLTFALAPNMEGESALPTVKTSAYSVTPPCIARTPHGFCLGWTGATRACCSRKRLSFPSFIRDRFWAETFRQTARRTGRAEPYIACLNFSKTS